jgi:hypothetical protein
MGNYNFRAMKQMKREKRKMKIVVRGICAIPAIEA